MLTFAQYSWENKTLLLLSKGRTKCDLYITLITERREKPISHLPSPTYCLVQERHTHACKTQYRRYVGLLCKMQQLQCSPALMWKKCEGLELFHLHRHRFRLLNLLYFLSLYKPYTVAFQSVQLEDSQQRDLCWDVVFNWSFQQPREKA